MGHVVETLGWLFVSFFVGALAQVTFVYSGLYFYYFRCNPLSYFKDLVEALTLAFASAPSAATLPVSLDCVAKSGKVNKDIVRFVLPLGATINMDGVAIYITCTAVALAYLNGFVPTAANYVILAFCATLGSIGTAPVPGKKHINLWCGCHYYQKSLIHNEQLASRSQWTRDGSHRL